eukprot:scaffold215047_cov30-Tisochrysis_lutea.AAC.2
MLTGWKGYFGDLIKYACESGPISRQRWLHKERKYRRCRDACAIVEKSVQVWPADSDASWGARYGGQDGKGPHPTWTSRLRFLMRRGRASDAKHGEEAIAAAVV